jgi:hypothetical protein
MAGGGRPNGSRVIPARRRRGRNRRGHESGAARVALPTNPSDALPFGFARTRPTRRIPRVAPRDGRELGERVGGGMRSRAAMSAGAPSRSRRAAVFPSSASAPSYVTDATANGFSHTL